MPICPTLETFPDQAITISMPAARAGEVREELGKESRVD